MDNDGRIEAYSCSQACTSQLGRNHHQSASFSLTAGVQLELPHPDVTKTQPQKCDRRTPKNIAKSGKINAQIPGSTIPQALPLTPQGTALRVPASAGTRLDPLVSTTATTVVIATYITLGWADQFRFITELQCINARPPSGGRDWTPASFI